jgi:hypothetical protein
MQFLPPEDAPKGEEGKNYLYTRVRLAWYYRPSDVSDRPLADSRLLLAAIYSEVCDINQLRAKCHVVQTDFTSIDYLIHISRKNLRSFNLMTLEIVGHSLSINSSFIKEKCLILI